MSAGDDTVLSVAIQAARSAAAVITDAARDLVRLPTFSKDHGDIVSTADVEAEADPLMGQEARDLVVDARGQQVGQGEDASQHQHRQYQRHLPSREIHHGK